jgi:uncharacterized membrane protein
MNKVQYLAELRRLLARLPEQEREAALQYYREYFEEAGFDSDADVSAELGHPQKVAAQILADSAMAMMQQPVKPPLRRRISYWWYVLLGILAAPVALPIVISALAVLGAAVITLLVLFCVGGGLFIAAVAAGITLCASGIAIIWHETIVGLLLIGTGLMLLALLMILLIPAFWLVKSLFQGITHLTMSFFQRLKNGGRLHEQKS